MAQNTGDTVILAEDEASLYLQATTLRVWAPKGQTPTVRIHTQRDKVHFYGCLNLTSGTETVMTTEVMNSETTAKFLEIIAQAYPGRPILILWDRAKWHGGSAVKEFLEANPRFDILKFPPGAPDLNPQEQVWKLTREKVSHNHDMAKLTQLAQAFEAHLKETKFKSTFLDQYRLDTICPMLN